MQLLLIESDKNKQDERMHRLKKPDFVAKGLQSTSLHVLMLRIYFIQGYTGMNYSKNVRIQIISGVLSLK